MKKPTSRRPIIIELNDREIVVLPSAIHAYAGFSLEDHRTSLYTSEAVERSYIQSFSVRK